MNAYIKSLRDEGYVSLRDEFYDNINAFPTLGKKDSVKTPDPDTIDIEDQTANMDDDGESEEAPERESHKDRSLDLPTDQSVSSPEKQTPEADQVKDPQLSIAEHEKPPVDSKEEAPNPQVKPAVDPLSIDSSESNDDAVKNMHSQLKDKLKDCGVFSFASQTWF